MASVPKAHPHQNVFLLAPLAGLLVLGLCGLAAGEEVSSRAERQCASVGGVRGDAASAASPNFSVRSHDPRHRADVVAAECERQRQQLQQQWLGTSQPPWQRRCEVVICANENAYLRSVGFQAAMTRGVSKVQRQQGRIHFRQIRLMADPQSKELTALAHELTHLVLADRFPCQPPRWADEGMALLADGAEKRSLHLRDLDRALSNRCCPGVHETLAMHDYPQGPRLITFYGQSLSLVSYLTEIDEPAKVVDMVALAMDRGYDAALTEVYGIADTAELERRWRRHLRNPPQLAAATR